MTLNMSRERVPHMLVQNRCHFKKGTIKGCFVEVFDKNENAIVKICVIFTWS